VENKQTNKQTNEGKIMKNQTTNAIMITIIPLLAMTFLAGCGNNSMNQSNATNSASGVPPAGSANTNSPSTNGAMNNMPAAEMTNAPAMTNGAGTNLPATTNK
jgi:hypothetical protein